MTIVRVKWTRDLGGKFPIPDRLVRSIEKDSSHYTFFLDSQSVTLLVVHPSHHAIYPDQDYTLFTVNRAIDVWETAPGSSKPPQIEAYIPTNAKDICREAIVETLRSLISTYKGPSELVPPISIPSA